jgi:hypothetical protein
MLCWPALTSVQRDVAQIAAGNDQIGTSAEAILASMKDVAQSARQVASVAEEAASASAQAAAAAKQQARGTEDLAAASKRLHLSPKPFSVAMANRRKQTRKIPIFPQTVVRLSRQILLRYSKIC